MSFDSEEYVQLENVRHQRAKRDYRCYACEETIRRGDIYKYTFSKFDGAVDTYRHCLRCAAMFDAIAKSLRDREYGDGIQYDLDCGHSWQETHFGKEPPEDVARLAFLTADEMQRELAPK